ncbi:hypothetical protein B484DRAFT_454263 [Ochromonadaceae sp. CCMP2298]|nr:hypothetical protein B484DRAFT_454263 [Ochromonadaceae sp. CCMP2298]
MYLVPGLAFWVATNAAYNVYCHTTTPQGTALLSAYCPEASGPKLQQDIQMRAKLAASPCRGKERRVQTAS